MRTAKDIAYKAWFENLIDSEDNPYTYTPTKKQERFENWWREWYHREDHKDCFYNEKNVFIDGKRYIKAE